MAKFLITPDGAVNIESITNIDVLKEEQDRSDGIIFGKSATNETVELYIGRSINNHSLTHSWEAPAILFEHKNEFLLELCNRMENGNTDLMDFVNYFVHQQEKMAEAKTAYPYSREDTYAEMFK